MSKFKVGDKAVVTKVVDISKEAYSIGDIGVIKDIVGGYEQSYYVNLHGGGNKKVADGIRYILESEIELYVPKSDNVWIPFKGGKCPVDFNTLVTVVDDNFDYSTGQAHYFKNINGEWDSSIIAYQVITPYKPPRENIIFKNKAEMLTELISRGKLYINEEGNEHVYFSEDEMYTLGYVHEDGRSESANCILEGLEFWVE